MDQPAEPVEGEPAVSIQLRRVSLRTHHGVTEAEREVGQRIEFDLDLELDSCPAAETDELDGTVDYGAVTALLVETATERSHLTLERLADSVARRMLMAYPTVGRIRVRATKPEPPISTVMDGASVQLVLSRRGPDRIGPWVD